VWEFNSSVVQFVFLGLFEAYYYQKVNISGSMVPVPVHSRINASWVIPPELHYGQKLILLTNLMNSIVLVFSIEATFVHCLRAPYLDFLRCCYSLATFFLILSSGCTVAAVSWNYAVDFYGQTTLEFPGTFPVTKEALIKKHLSHVFPLGMVAATFSLISAVMFMSEIYAMKQGNQVKPMVWAKYVSQKD
jgi:hypothetical protein